MTSDGGRETTMTHPTMPPTGHEEVSVSSAPEAYTGVPVWRGANERGTEGRDSGENATTTTRRRGGAGREESFGPRERLALCLLAIAIAAVALLPFFAVGDLWTSEVVASHVEEVRLTAVESDGEGNPRSRARAVVREVGVSTDRAAAEADIDDGTSEQQDPIDEGSFSGVGARPLTRSTFRSFVRDNAFIAFCVSWCNHCKHLRPTWDEFAVEVESMRLPVTVGLVECSAERKLCAEQGIVAFPTLRWYKGGAAVAPDYDGVRTAEAFVEFAEEKMTKVDERSSQLFPSDEVVGDEDTDEVGGSTEEGEDTSSAHSGEAAPTNEAAFSCEGARPLTRSTILPFVHANKHAFVAFYAPWCKLCERLRPVMDELATELKELALPVAVGYVECSADWEFCSEKSIENIPTLRWYDDGRKSETTNIIMQWPVEAFVEFARGKIFSEDGVASVLPSIEKIFEDKEDVVDDEEEDDKQVDDDIEKIKDYSEALREKEGSAQEASSLSEDGARPLTRSTFRLFLEENEHAFVDFDVPWSVWCLRLRPTWGKFAAEVEARGMPVAVGSVDCVAEKELCAEENIMSFPTLRWYDAGRVAAPDYRMDRTVKSFVGYTERRISYTAGEQDRSTLAHLDETQVLSQK